METSTSTESDLLTAGGEAEFSHPKNQELTVNHSSLLHFATGSFQGIIRDDTGREAIIVEKIAGIEGIHIGHVLIEWYCNSKEMSVFVEMLRPSG